MPQPKRKAPAKKKAAAKRKPAAQKPPEPEIQVNRMNETTAPPANETTNPDPPLFEGTPNELDDNGETQADRDAAGAVRGERVLTPGLRGKEEVPEYEPERPELEHAGFDHHAAEEKRQAELDAEREVHNARTGDASL